MKYLIVGLGNIGAEYEATRHNVGFMAIDTLLGHFDLTTAPNRYADTTIARFKGRQLVLVKPSTYMNLSGKAVRYYMEQEKIPIERTLIIYDDIALPFGQLRIRAKGSDGGHNGLKSINQLLGRQDYPRLRVGIGNDFGPGQQVDYVLGPFSSEQENALPEVLDICKEAVFSFISAGIERTMSTFNRKS